ncbi:MAG: 16S rRNA (cytidine(1402)-2'-O)-methyltransferase [bacterium]|nr:16S rRNA (cytidine(1402)-2'-O)-methyltransferase [bacterium]
MEQRDTASRDGHARLKGALFVVATPIGNLGDITKRALQVLSDVDLIAAEDTRHSKKLLDHFAIDTPLISYHDHNEQARAESLLKELAMGRDVALVTDAGTPCVSDPGYRIVRSAQDQGYRVVAVPGASALPAALSVSGLPNTQVTFHGFFPRKKGDAERLIAKAVAFGGTHAFFESPNRLRATLHALGEHAAGAEVCVARELTKQFEEVVRGTAEEVLAQFEDRKVKGECVVLVHAQDSAGGSVSDEELQRRVRDAMEIEGLSHRDAAREVAASLGVPRRRVYEATLDR